jgi:pimeloyl-ACP methyl ester carboxylesterase
MRDTEIKAAGRLAGDALAGTAAIAGDVQRAVSERIFGLLGVVGAPVRVMHDGIAGAVDASVRAGMRAVPAGGARALARLAPPAAAPLAQTRPGSFVLGAVNGALGDRIAREYGALALPLTLRHDGRDLPADVADATARVVVFVHGLCETDAAWELGGAGYGTRLRDEEGYTPLYVRYNTGLHISANGRALSDALESLVASWPVEVEELVLVGHSMGGLVSRSAAHYGHLAGGEWTRVLKHVFCLGSPHLGAPLERAANAGGSYLSRLPETAPFARLLTVRSAGIKDLRYGSCLEDDWCDCGPDEFLNDRCHECPFLPTATYYFVGATVTRDKDSRLGRIVGDLLVQFPSASGDGPRRRLAFEIENGLHLGRTHHLQLLNHPAVYEQLGKWLRRAATAAAA